MNMAVVAFALLCLVAVASASPMYSAKNLTNSDFDEHWLAWKVFHTKSYDSPSLEVQRRLVWETNFKEITLHNLEHSLGKKSYRLGMNQFGDMTHKEFRGMMTGLKKNYNETKAPGGSTYLPPNFSDEPDTVDWREKGYVTAVKDQGQCGSCWAFSTTGSLEGQTFKKSGTLPDLSEQQLVDCSGSYGNMGCSGGLMDQAFQYIKDNGGLDTEDSYTYTAEDGTCEYNPSNVGATCTGYVDVTSEDEDALKSAVATVGPISVAIDAGHESFQFYESGVYDEPSCSSEQLDHGVLCVGYGTEDGSDYWLVKNSWATTWGDKGYIKMSRNKQNQCGIATSASYPLV